MMPIVPRKVSTVGGSNFGGQLDDFFINLLALSKKFSICIQHISRSSIDSLLMFKGWSILSYSAFLSFSKTSFNPISSFISLLISV